MQSLIIIGLSGDIDMEVIPQVNDSLQVGVRLTRAEDGIRLGDQDHLDVHLLFADAQEGTDFCRSLLELLEEYKQSREVQE